MAKAKFTGKGASSKADRPDKPYPEFPLFAHATGNWVKKIGGSLHYFGRWGRVKKGVMTWIDDGGAWQKALELYKAQIGDIISGRKPRATEDDRITVKELCDRFYTAKQRKHEAGELSPRTLAEYDATCARLVKAFGRNRRVADLDADDFGSLRASIAKQWGPTRLGNEVGRVKTIFKYALDNDLIDRQVRFGSEFVKPSKPVMRKHKAKQGQTLFAADEIRKLLDGGTVQDGDDVMIPPASVPLRAMILLGVNAGFGNSDCGSLPIKALDLDGGWLSFPRPKTGIDRRAKLWPETVAALREAIAKRPAPTNPEHDGLVFITKYGKPWAAEGRGDVGDGQAAQETADQRAEPPGILLAEAHLQDDRRRGAGSGGG